MRPVGERGLSCRGDRDIQREYGSLCLRWSMDKTAPLSYLCEEERGGGLQLNSCYLHQRLWETTSLPDCNLLPSQMISTVEKLRPHYHWISIWQQFQFHTRTCVQMHARTHTRLRCFHLASFIRLNSLFGFNYSFFSSGRSILMSPCVL